MKYWWLEISFQGKLLVVTIGMIWQNSCTNKYKHVVINIYFEHTISLSIVKYFALETELVGSLTNYIHIIHSYTVGAKDAVQPFTIVYNCGLISCSRINQPSGNRQVCKTQLSLLLTSCSVHTGQWEHGLSQQGVWVPFWTPKPLKRTPQDTQISLSGIFKNPNLKLVIEFFFISL